MLRVIPRSPRRIDAPAIHVRLKDLGMAVSLRKHGLDFADAGEVLESRHRLDVQK